MRVIAVIPAFNEAPRLKAVLSNLKSHVDEVIVVDDGSHDDTAAIAQAEEATMLRHAVNRGQGAALKTGTLAALQQGADIIIHLDADGQHHPDEIVQALLEPIRKG